MNEQPLVIPDASPEVLREHYEHLRRHLIQKRASEMGLLTLAEHRFIDRARLSARLALTALETGR